MLEMFVKKSPLRTPNTQTNAPDLMVRASLVPLSLITTLYFLWGFAYGLLDTLNKHVQIVLGISRSRSSGLQVAYFGAYLLAPAGYATWILRHYGYKATFMIGLFLYGVGALLMWPAAQHRSFEGLCGATFIIGSGLATLETAANPFMAVCGPPRYCEIRINLAQSFQAIGTVVGPVLGSYVFFKTTSESPDSLRSVQLVYLSIAVFVFLLAGVFYFAYIPEITDADMQVQARSTYSAQDEKPFKKQYQLFHAVIAQWCYAGAQVAIASYFINYMTETRKNTDATLAAKFLAVAQGVFTIGRFSGALLMKFVRPRLILLVYVSGTIAFTAASITQRENTGLAMLIMAFFSQSICFPTIIALAIHGLGRHTKRGSGLLIAGVSGGAVVPPILAAVADARNNTALAMVIPTMFQLVTMTYAICVNFVKSYREPTDRARESTIGLVESHKSDMREEKEEEKEKDEGIEPLETVLAKKARASVTSTGFHLRSIDLGDPSDPSYRKPSLTCHHV